MRMIYGNRNFVLFFFGQTLSGLGTTITNFAIPWLLLRLTGSSLQLGFAFAIETIAYLVASLPAGVWMDTHNRRRTMIFADIARLFLLGLIPFVQFIGEMHVWSVYLALIGVSMLDALFDAGSSATLPNLVNRADLRQANAIMQSGQSVGRLLGPVLSGVLVFLFDPAKTLLFDIGTYIISAATLYAINAPFSSPITKADQGCSSMTPVKARVKLLEGMSYIWGNKMLRNLTLYAFVVNLWGEAVFTILFFRMQHEIHLSAVWAGTIMATVGVGSLLGSLSAGWLCAQIPTDKLWNGIALCQVMAPLILSVTSSAPLIAVAILLDSFLIDVWNVQFVSLRQELIPDRLLARCSSTIRMVGWTSRPLGSAFSGGAAQWIGARGVFLASAVVQLGLGVWSVASPTFRTDKHGGIDAIEDNHS